MGSSTAQTSPGSKLLPKDIQSVQQRPSVLRSEHWQLFQQIFDRLSRLGTTDVATPALVEAICRDDTVRHSKMLEQVLDGSQQWPCRLTTVAQALEYVRVQQGQEAVSWDRFAALLEEAPHSRRPSLRERMAEQGASMSAAERAMQEKAAADMAQSILTLAKGCAENGLFLVSDARLLLQGTPCGSFADWFAERRRSTTIALTDMAGPVKEFCYERCMRTAPSFDPIREPEAANRLIERELGLDGVMLHRMHSVFVYTQRGGIARRADFVRVLQTSPALSSAMAIAVVCPPAQLLPNQVVVRPKVWSDIVFDLARYDAAELTWEDVLEVVAWNRDLCLDLVPPGLRGPGGLSAHGGGPGPAVALDSQKTRLNQAMSSSAASRSVADASQGACRPPQVASAQVACSQGTVATAPRGSDSAMWPGARSLQPSRACDQRRGNHYEEMLGRRSLSPARAVDDAFARSEAMVMGASQNRSGSTNLEPRGGSPLRSGLDSRGTLTGWRGNRMMDYMDSDGDDDGPPGVRAVDRVLSMPVRAGTGRRPVTAQPHRASDMWQGARGILRDPGSTLREPSPPQSRKAAVKVQLDGPAQLPVSERELEAALARILDVAPSSVKLRARAAQAVPDTGNGMRRRDSGRL